MNAIETVKKSVEDTFPNLRLELDCPDQPGGNWVIDVYHDDDRIMAIEWRPDRGIGISSCDGPLDKYGEAPDELHLAVPDAVQRIVCLLQEGRKTIPPSPTHRAALRVPDEIPPAVIAG